ncbi:MAG: LacI family transcriptional regulator [Candidatus Omnitrophica bacterium]|nr:LacI family transcriptional regulator [Candidatus Omnitrophota bacterium]
MAKMAGISVATISRATNPETRSKIAPATLKKIDALIKKYKYVPNLAARELNNPGIKTIGIVFPYNRDIFYSAYYTHLLSSIANFLLDTDYRFKLILFKQKKRKWDWYDFKIGEGVSGIILTHWFMFFSKKRLQGKWKDVPYVIINDFDKSIKGYFVYEDSFSGGEEAAKYLYNLGHRNVAIITGSHRSSDSNRRQAGFQSFYKDRGIFIDSDSIVEGDFGDNKKTFKAVDDLVRLKRRPTAMFCCNDNIAFAAINRLKEKGVSCPGNISVIGYDDDPSSRNFNPPLTTIRVPLYDLGQRAIEVLLNHIRNKSQREGLYGQSCFPVQLIERQSVKAIISNK